MQYEGPLMVPYKTSINRRVIKITATDCNQLLQIAWSSSKNLVCSAGQKIPVFIKPRVKLPFLQWPAIGIYPEHMYVILKGQS
jgi:hypothetical protein